MGENLNTMIFNLLDTFEQAGVKVCIWWCFNIPYFVFASLCDWCFHEVFRPLKWVTALAISWRRHTVGFLSRWPRANVWLRHRHKHPVWVPRSCAGAAGTFEAEIWLYALHDGWLHLSEGVDDDIHSSVGSLFITNWVPLLPHIWPGQVVLCWYLLRPPPHTIRDACSHRVSAPRLEWSWEQWQNVFVRLWAHERKLLFGGRGWSSYG